MTKQIFGIILTVLGIAGLIWAALIYLGMSAFDIWNAWVPFVLGLIFFIAGVGMIKNLDKNEDTP